MAVCYLEGYGQNSIDNGEIKITYNSIYYTNATSYTMTINRTNLINTMQNFKLTDVVIYGGGLCTPTYTIVNGNFQFGFVNLLQTNSPFTYTFSLLIKYSYVQTVTKWVDTYDNYGRIVQVQQTEDVTVSSDIKTDDIELVCDKNPPSNPIISLTSDKSNVYVHWNHCTDDLSNYDINYNGGINYYDVTIRNINQSFLEINPGYSTKTFDNLEKCTNYTVTVKCTDIAGNTSSSSASISTTSDIPTSLPKNDDETSIKMPDLKATQSIQLNPGFKFTPSITNSLIAHIVPACSIITTKAFILDSVNTQIENAKQVTLSTSNATTVNTATSFQQQIPSSNTVYNFSIAPNPAKNTIKVSMPDEQNTVEIYSMNGVKVYSQSVNSNVVDIDVSAFASGIYVLKAVSPSYSKTLEFSKE